MSSQIPNTMAKKPTVSLGPDRDDHPEDDGHDAESHRPAPRTTCSAHDLNRVTLYRVRHDVSDLICDPSAPSRMLAQHSFPIGDPCGGQEHSKAGA